MPADGAIRSAVITSAALAAVSVAFVLAVAFRGSATAAHDERFMSNYFALPFIEDIPNTTFAVRVAECAGQGHSDASVIDAAIARWNATSRIEYFRDPNNPTVSCDVDGWPPAGSGVIAVSHRGTRAFFQADTAQTSDRANDWGPEAGTVDSLGMYPMSRARIWFSDDSVGTLTHELGHGAGLSDLYSPDYDCGSSCPPCTDVNPYGSVTVMDCSTDHGSGIPQQDIDSLNLMYRRIPQTIPAGGANWRITGRTATSVSFAWTDYSFNERDQLIGQDNDNNGVNEGLPISIARDLESATWAGLPGAKFYCFNIAQRNAYGDAAAKSPNVCGSTTGVEPSNVRVCSVPCDLFGFKDNASNETGFGVIVQKRTSCSSGSWSTVDQFLLPPKSGTDDVYAYNFVGPGCFRVRVQALGAGGATSNLISSSGIYFPN